ncbi:MAG: hypothetical protein ABW032_10285 [Burkholderiaceae bacterium]
MASAGCAIGADVPASRPPLAQAAGMPTWSPSLELPSLEALPSRWARPFAERIDLIRRGGRLTASDCKELLAARAGGASPLGDRALGIERDEGAKCIALEQLSRVRPARSSHLAGFALPEAALADLPPTFATPFARQDDEDARAAEAQGRTLADVRPGIVARSQDGLLVLRGDTWQTQMEVLARGDFDGGGVEELLIAAHDTAIEGTYDSTRLLLVTRGPEGRRLRTLKRLQ